MFVPCWRLASVSIAAWKSSCFEVLTLEVIWVIKEVTSQNQSVRSEIRCLWNWKGEFATNQLCFAGWPGPWDSHINPQKTRTLVHKERTLHPTPRAPGFFVLFYFLTLNFLPVNFWPLPLYLSFKTYIKFCPLHKSLPWLTSLERSLLPLDFFGSPVGN